jgi:hypothetical protein
VTRDQANRWLAVNGAPGLELSKAEGVWYVVGDEGVVNHAVERCLHVTRLEDLTETMLRWKVEELTGKSAPTKQIVARRQNAAARRERILAEGGRALYTLLEADPAAALAHFEAAGYTATAVVSELLVNAQKTGWMPEKPTQ